MNLVKPVLILMVAVMLGAGALAWAADEANLSKPKPFVRELKTGYLLRVAESSSVRGPRRFQWVGHVGPLFTRHFRAFFLAGPAGVHSSTCLSASRRARNFA